MPETLNFTFTSKELQTVIETAVEKALNRMRINLSLADRNNGKVKFVKIKEFAQEVSVTPEAVHKVGTRKEDLRGKIRKVYQKYS
jgi:hypothetical protein